MTLTALLILMIPLKEQSERCSKVKPLCLQQLIYQHYMGPGQILYEEIVKCLLPHNGLGWPLYNISLWRVSPPLVILSRLEVFWRNPRNNWAIWYNLPKNSNLKEKWLGSSAKQNLHHPTCRCSNNSLSCEQVFQHLVPDETRHQYQHQSNCCPNTVFWSPWFCIFTTFWSPKPSWLSATLRSLFVTLLYGLTLPSPTSTILSTQSPASTWCRTPSHTQHNLLDYSPKHSSPSSHQNYSISQIDNCRLFTTS